MPGRANRRAFEAFAFEDIDGRGQVGFGLSNLAPSRERLEETLVRPLIERRELEPCVEVQERLVVGAAHDQLLEHCRAAAAKPTTLCRQPGGKHGAAVNRQTLEEFPVEQCRERCEWLRRQRLDPGLSGPQNVEHVHPAVRQIELNRVPTREHWPARIVVEQATDLAQAPSQFAARIVGDVPQQLAQLSSGDGLLGQRHVSEQRAYLARGWKREGAASTRYPQRAEHVDFERPGRWSGVQDE